MKVWRWKNSIPPKGTLSNLLLALARDDFGVANTRHDADTNNGGVSNLSNVEGEEVDGVTTIRFTIPLDSGDELDRVLTPGNKHKMLAAHGLNGADDFGTYHGERGSAEITL